MTHPLNRKYAREMATRAKSEQDYHTITEINAAVAGYDNLLNDLKERLERVVVVFSTPDPDDNDERANLRRGKVIGLSLALSYLEEYL